MNRPSLHWTGKRPISEIRGYPIQLIETSGGGGGKKR